VSKLKGPNRKCWFYWRNNYFIGEIRKVIGENHFLFATRQYIIAIYPKAGFVQILKKLFLKTRKRQRPSRRVILQQCSHIFHLSLSQRYVKMGVGCNGNN
jgi:hypothetical protein